MAHFHVPGVSVAVAEGGRVAWARGVGVKRAGDTRPVTATTIFEAASISKPVTATATLRLVGQGKLSLDEDVNTYLRSWHVPDNAFTARARVTLRRILSHSAGTTVHGFPGYARDAPLPTVQQILDGVPPANTQPVRVDLVPGTESRYSGGGATIEQLVLVEVTGTRFPALLQDLVLGPLGMADSTFEQPLPASRAPDACDAHDVKGAPIPGGYQVYPELAAAGLWATPTDLLRWAIAIAAARAGASPAERQILPRALATEMLTVQKAPFGLGPIVRGEGHALYFGHQGEDEGFVSDLIYFPETGQGAAVMVNGAAGGPLISEILYGIAAEYGWPGYGPDEITPVKVDTRTLDAIVGRYEATFEVYTIAAEVRLDGGRLWVDAPRLGILSEAIFTSPTSVTLLDNGDPLTVVTGADGKVSALRYGSIELPRR
jgi:CubicO group peptidase (beta-lactamase class C family)